MLIDVTNPASYPLELKDLIRRSISRLSQKEINDLCKRLTSGEKPEIVFESQYSCSAKYSWYQEVLVPLFRQYDLACYHVTKAIEPERFLQTGLNTNDIERYCKCFRNDLQQCGFSDQEQDYLIKLVQEEYNRKYTYWELEPLLFFTSGIDMLNEGYDQFTENIGGELIRWPLENNNPDMQKRLRQYGKPCVVKFKLPFNRILECNQDCIVQQFVYYFLAKDIANIDYHIAFDAKTSSDIPPNDIIDVLPCEEVIYDE